ncbi:MAG: S9 family peptidase [Gemmatimonadaceae bacterium]
MLRSIRLLSFVVLAVPAVAMAQQPRQATASDYARAAKFLSYNVNPLVSGVNLRPTWLPDGRLWYRNTTPGGGSELILIDPAKGARVNCTADTQRCAGAIDPAELAHRGDTPMRRPASGRAPEIVSPDGKRAVFIRDWNLWLRDVATSAETPLTTDGVKDFGYATDNAGWVRSDRPIVAWSPDSKRLFTFRQDQRNVGEMYLYTTVPGHPTLSAWKYPLPGDSVVSMLHRVFIDLRGPSPRVIPLQMEPDQHRSTLCDHITCRGTDFADVQWYPDGSKVAFVSSSRDHKVATLRIADAATGAVRDVLREEVATQYESGQTAENWRVLPASNEVIWYSERDDWGNLYLYDIRGGPAKLTRQVTTGPGNVAEILRVDEQRREILFTGVGKTAGRDPYFRHLYRIRMDGKGLTLLTPENADHAIELSPNGRWVTDSYSRPEQPPVHVVRDARSGRVLVTLEKGDVSRLVATGWKAPIPITVKARDGTTDLYGLMYVPTTLDSTRKYPIINHIYPGPQTGSVGGRQFAAARGDNQALAELGFVVVEIDGMGTPWRSKSFHDAYYGRMIDNTVPDQVAGMKELARRYRWIDVERAGIWGHSGGGFATAAAMFLQPDFFKVGISESGNHDNRHYEDDWGERYQGLLVRRADGTDNYQDEATPTYAKHLKGKLLLAHGTLDDNVPPNNTLLVVEALIKANKDFDLLMLPNQAHGYGSMSYYMMRRRWDYFLKNLAGVEPPKEFQLGPPPTR